MSLFCLAFRPKLYTGFAFTSLVLTLVLSFNTPANAQQLSATDGATSDNFGGALGVSGNAVLVGAIGDDDNGSLSGSAYYFRIPNDANGMVNENLKLTASDGQADDRFGASVSLSGDSALVGARLGDGNNIDSGSAYYFNQLDSAGGSTVNEAVKLVASDGATGDSFGGSVSLFGDSALVGSRSGDGNNLLSGTVYYFRNLNTVAGAAVDETAKLVASDGASGDSFGNSVSLHDDSALVGALGDRDNGISSGSAYYFQNLNGASGTVNENVKLIASDGAASDFFASSVSLFGDSSLIGALRGDGNVVDSGSAYYFADLDNAGGAIVNETLKLIASDGTSIDNFGGAVSLYGDSALVGASGVDDANGSDSGGAYYFVNLDTAADTVVTETLKLTAFDGSTNDRFGSSVGISGDRITVGAATGDGNVVNSGSAYTARISNMTTLDEGNVLRTHKAINFESRVDWIIGETTDNNSLTLSAGTMAVVDGAGQSIMIGAMAGAGDNSLTVEGMIEGMDLFIGSMTGNMGNQLVMTASGVLDVDNLHLAAGNRLLIEGDVSDFGDLLAYLSSTMRPTDLFADDMLGGWQLIDSSNASSFLVSSFDSSTGFTTITNIPEPGTATLLGLVAFVAIGRRRRNG